jgi:hypothetical protein
MRWSSIRLGVVAVCAGWCLMLSAGAVRGGPVISYTTRTAFDAAFPGATRETWDEFANGTVFANGSTVNGITYNSSNGNALVTNGFLTTTPPNGLGETTNGFFLASDTIKFTFSRPLTAFGIDINTFDASATGGYRATLSNGDTAPSFFDPFPGFTTGQFLGFSDATPFTSVTISAPGGFSFTLDTLRSQAAAVPEPSGLALFGLAILGASVARARRRRRLARAG